MQDLKVTLIQTSLHWENIEANLSMFSKKIAAIPEQTDVIVLPEMFSTGFSMNIELAESMDGKAFQWMKQQAADKNCVITGSLMIQESGNIFNRLIWMRADGSFEIYDKRHLFSLSQEPALFTAGKKKIIVEVNGWKICPLICYDLRFPIWSRNIKSEYDMLLYVANWPERRNTAWKALLQARAIENQCYVIAVNRIGEDGQNIYHSGDSSVIDALGNIVYQKADEDATYTCTLRYQELLKTREQLPFLKDADDFEIKH